MIETIDGFVTPGRARPKDEFLRLKYVLPDRRDLGAQLGAIPANKTNDLVVRNAIIIEVTTAAYQRDARWLAVSGDRNEYVNLSRFIGPFGSFRTVSRAVEDLVAARILVKCQTRPSPHARYRSTIQAGQIVRDAGVLWRSTDLARYIHEAVRLKDKNKRLQNYHNTAFTRRRRRDLRALNEHLGCCTITLDSPSWHLNDHGRYCGSERTLNPAANQLYCVFNRAWRLGGRFYGGWWQQLPQIDRMLLRINNQKVCELDYDHIHPTLISAISGIELGHQDPYSIDGFDRKHVKLAFNILVNARSQLSGIKAIQRKLVELQCRDPLRTAYQLVQVVKSHHPKFSFAWGTGFGLRLQNIDAEMCAEIQRIMLERGHPILSVHDSFIVIVSAIPHLEEVMGDVLARTKKRLAMHNGDILRNSLF